MTGVRHGFATQWEDQRGYLFSWVPVALACGIGLYFLIRIEPPVWVLWAVGIAGLVGLGALSRRVIPMQAAGIAICLAACGFAIAGARAHGVAGPVLDFRYYGPIEGRIVGIDRSASDAVRLTLDRVVLERMAPEETPKRVRVSLHGLQGFAPLHPGAVVIMTGHLSGPQGAVEPGGFDFRRHAWFLGLGGVGYTRSPVLMLEDAGDGQRIFKTRMALSAHVQSVLPGETGAFAAAVMTGDRSGIGQETLQDLRDSNLAHLLAISGLHMGLLAGFVFASLRIGFLVIPYARHHLPVKGMAALGALAAAACYLALSGGNVATERAFVMVAVALVAVCLNRRALSLRAVAMAALIVLVAQPEALLGPGFQMSFAATVALVAVFEKLSAHGVQQRVPRWTAGILSLLVSSAIAGLATAPVGMAHFNQSSHYGLLANLVSVPVMGAIVVPCAVVAALLLPLGLDGLALAVMAMGLEWILGVAHWVAELPGAVRHVPAPPRFVLPLLALSGLWLCLWRGWGRAAAVIPATVLGLVWFLAERPAVLIAAEGNLVGVMTPEGRALSRARGAGFVAETWLENDGSGRDQAAAADLWPLQDRPKIARIGTSGTEIIHLQGKSVPQTWSECTPGQLIVAEVSLDLQGPCVVISPDSLKHSGALAVFVTDTGSYFLSDRDVTGHRLWNPGPKTAPVDVAARSQ